MQVEISGGSIKLGQFLKLVNLVESGGHAKEVIVDGLIYVNGEPASSRGQSLIDGDVVSVPSTGDSVTIVADGASPEERSVERRNP